MRIESDSYIRWMPYEREICREKERIEKESRFIFQTDVMKFPRKQFPNELALS